MLTKRLIACFDVVNGRVTKALRFQDNLDVAPAEMLAESLYDEQIDELVLYDITASAQKRTVDLGMVSRVASRLFVPLTVGGGIRSAGDMYAALKAGAEKISVDSMAVRRPEIIADGARAFGSQCIVLSVQLKRTDKTPEIPSGYEVYIDGAGVATGLDGLAWIKRGEALGAGEICLNSIDGDGTLAGYDLALMRLAGETVKVPLIASGGAGAPEHLRALFSETEAQGAIISSMLYSPRTRKRFTVRELKRYLGGEGIPVRPVWTPARA